MSKGVSHFTTQNYAHSNCDVAIIGSGPAGISAAITLKESGIDNIIVIEREPEAGGIPRHCDHVAFGFKKYKRILTGSQYAKNNIALALNMGINIQLKTTVTHLGKEGKLTLVSPQEISELSAKRVLIATGTRELPRSAQFISGDRALGICNTGVLQAMVYLKNKIPFRYPVIVGTEIVSFSALLTCKKGGIKPIAMIEESSRPLVRWPIYYGAPLFGTKLLLATKIIKIVGNKRVESVEVESRNGEQRSLACDGVLFTGKFTPESSLVRMSHLDFDPESYSPNLDSSGRCSDPAYYVAGNVYQLPKDVGRNRLFYTAGHVPNAVKTSGQCWDDGAEVARNIIQDLRN